jgi:NAD(P)-dependent dehydrogenase (short-subunit alcohol dehydrogenase family)
VSGVAIVTGGGSGIGAAISKRLAADGFAVVVADIDEAGCTRTVSEIGASALGVSADASDYEDCERIVAEALHLGELRVVVNCAGVMVDRDSVSTISDSELERLFAVNVFGVFRLARASVPALRQAAGSVIVTVSSVHAFKTQDRTAAYAASKGAIVALTRQMAIDLAPDGIRVVGVAPGAVDTPMTEENLRRRDEATNSRFPAEATAIGRMAQPDEVATLVAFLVSERASIINGQTVLADSGLTAKLI